MFDASMISSLASRSTTRARAALGKLAAFGGVSRFPARVKCASLSWHAMRAALRGADSGVSTE